MSKYITVSTKVRKELKEEAEKLGIKISEVLRRALEEEVKKEKLKRLEKKLSDISNVLDKINMDNIVRGIREDRENR
ncbi:MAG: type II toxin-antitoxin system CcdA family antitoxin [Nitrososphaerota archaeon]